MTLPIPTEAVEQKMLVRYLRLRKLPHFRVPNETYTKSIRQKANNTALGVSSGVPDLFVIAGGRLIGVEMKRTKGGSVSESQRYWIEQLNGVGVETRVCRGYDEAVAFIESIEKSVPQLHIDMDALPF